MDGRVPVVRLTAWLIALPVSAALIAATIILVAWPTLPTDMPTHWGAGGVGTMPRVWAVGLPVGMICVATVVTLARAVVVAADPRRLLDTAVMSGLVAWVGLGALAASVWPAELGFTLGLLTVVVILPITLVALVNRYVVRRLPERRRVTGFEQNL